MIYNILLLNVPLTNYGIIFRNKENKVPTSPDEVDGRFLFDCFCVGPFG